MTATAHRLLEHQAAPPPLAPVSVTSCRDCPLVDAVGWASLRPVVHCRIAGTLMLRADAVPPPDGCPLRSGPVTIRLGGAA